MGKLDSVFPRTYATRANAVRAAEKALTRIEDGKWTRWWVVATEDGRFGLIALYTPGNLLLAHTGVFKLVS